MGKAPHTIETLHRDLQALGIRNGDGLFVHASLAAIGATNGGAASVISALQQAVGGDGLLAMPGFSSDAHFPAHIDRTGLGKAQIRALEDAVPGFDPANSPTHDMGAIAESFRTWPGTIRSQHPTVSICLLGPGSAELAAHHALAWAMGADTPMGRLIHRPRTKILLIGVVWNRCSALHTAETFAAHNRTKTRRFKLGQGTSEWCETPDVADDLGRLFPQVGAAYEASGKVTKGQLGAAPCLLCDYGDLVAFATQWIAAANAASGDLH